MNKSLYFGFLLFFLLEPLSVIAHENRPVLVEISEIQPSIYSVLWKIPEGGLMKGKLYPVFPTACEIRGNAETELAYARVNKQIIHCDGGLAGKTIGVHDLDLNVAISAFVRVSFLSGQQHSKILLNTSPEFIVPVKEDRVSIIKSYTLLGLEHIAFGIDHLLFVACLMMLVQGYKLLVWTITGFTIAHSISLAASVFKLVQLPVVFVETCIALSIVFLAAEIVRENRQSLSYQKPFLISSFFGLFHGLGFANVLLELGLPQIELGLGLLFFNLGVELGQLGFILLLLLFATLFRFARNHSAASDKDSSWYQKRVFSPAIGCIAAFWVIQRLEDFV
jgi:hydrogenase/urease accessory protein HupE